MAAHDTRRRELAAIHIGAKALELDRETYECMLWSVARVRSAADLDHAGRRAVIEHLRRRGFRPKPAPATERKHGSKPQVPADRQGLVDKLEALLADAARPWNYARAMARRMFGVERLEWATAEQLRRLVAALSYDARRRAARKAAP